MPGSSSLRGRRSSIPYSADLSLSLVEQGRRKEGLSLAGKVASAEAHDTAGCCWEWQAVREKHTQTDDQRAYARRWGEIACTSQDKVAEAYVHTENGPS